MQDKLNTNTNKKGGNRDGEWISNLFPNRVKCAACNGTISTHNAKCGDVIQRYFKCSTARQDNTKCQCRRMLVINAIEEDFFLLFQKEHPSELLGKQTTSHQLKVAKLNVAIKAEEKTQDDISKMFGKYPVKAIDKALAESTARMDALTTQRDELSQAQRAISNAPSSVVNIRKALNLADDNLDKAANQIVKALADLETRKRLVQYLPNIVDHLTVDLEKGSYTITTKDGKTSGNRSVVDLPTL